MEILSAHLVIVNVIVNIAVNSTKSINYYTYLPKYGLAGAVLLTFMPMFISGK